MDLMEILDLPTPVSQNKAAITPFFTVVSVSGHCDNDDSAKSIVVVRL